MRFRRQVRWALTRGIGAVLTGIVLAIVTVTLEAFEVRNLALLGWLTMWLMAGGAMLALAGGVMRPAQRWALQHGMPSGRLRQVMLDRPILRWWYWVEADGRARDD